MLLKHRGLTGKYFIDSPAPLQCIQPQLHYWAPQLQMLWARARTQLLQPNVGSPACHQPADTTDALGQHPGFVATSGQAVDHNSDCKWSSDSAGSYKDSCSWEGHLGVWLLAGTILTAVSWGTRLAPTNFLKHRTAQACWEDAGFPQPPPTHSGRAISRVQAASRGMEMVRPQVSLRTGYHSEDKPASRPA